MSNLNVQRGYYVQNLSFQLELKSIAIEHVKTTEPRSALGTPVLFSN